MGEMGGTWVRKWEKIDGDRSTSPRKMRARTFEKLEGYFSFTSTNFF